MTRSSRLGALALAAIAALAACGGSDTTSPPPSGTATSDGADPWNDAIELTGPPNHTDRFGYVVGRRSTGCIGGRGVRGTGALTLGNVLADGAGCQPQFALFEPGQGMREFEVTTLFTDGIGDRIPANVQPKAHRVKTVTIHVLKLTSFGLEDAKASATDDLKHAGKLYNDQGCGVAFQMNGPHDATSFTGNVNTVCANATPLKNSGHYEAGALNVYYAEGFIDNGFWCVGYPDIVIVRVNAPIETLAHEIGHALSLDHHPDPDNVMASGVTGRHNFTERQCFDANKSDLSVLNR